MMPCGAAAAVFHHLPLHLLLLLLLAALWASPVLCLCPGRAPLVPAGAVALPRAAQPTQGPSQTPCRLLVRAG
jgi:hypothetical protein